MGMPFDVALHNCIEKNNVLLKPTEQTSTFFRERPQFYKVALLVNHVFRALAMAAFCYLLPFAAPISIGICFAGSLFYRLTVETNCAYKFALPAFAGSLAIPLAVKALAHIITGVALVSLGTFAIAVLSMLPLVAYVTYIAATVNYDVNHR
jgi:hypothetical protein